MNLMLTRLNRLIDLVDKCCIGLLQRIFIILVSFCLLACQTTQQSPSKVVALNTVNFGQYYLALKNLSYNELENEIQQQELKKLEGSIEAEINLILLHSLPNSPTYNVYSAKSKLNEQLKLHQNYYLSSDDKAFIYLLKDQLNQQLYLFQQVINQQLEHDKQMSKTRIKEKKLLNKIAALELTVAQLDDKIIQLKNIEQTISEHGQQIMKAAQLANSKAQDNINEKTLTQEKILIVDDDPSLLRLLGIRLSAAGYLVESAANAKIALGMLKSFHPQLVISDLRMEGMDGMALFEQIRQQSPNLPVIIMTAHGTIPDAINATKQGVFSFLTKPFESQQLLETVEKAIQLQPLSTKSESKQDLWRTKIISRSAIMESLLQQTKQVAVSDFSLLIHSESGTGKELLAKAIHQASHRADKPFTAINCAAIPEQLLESELFGHVKGAFTGAEKNHQGLFQASDGGTLFLDEVGDMPMSFQVKLLRSLQEKEVRPVGSTQAIKVDVRIISATHKNLQEAIKEKTFREDLYYRLNVVELELPPLAQRREDIPLLAQHFLNHSNHQTSLEINGFSQEAMEILIAAPWPGNIRQLQNVVEQSVALSRENIIVASLVKHALRDESSVLPSFQQAKDEFERDYLAKLLKLTAGNVSQAARIAQRNRTEFYKLLNRHHLTAESFREED